MILNDGEQCPRRCLDLSDYTFLCMQTLSVQSPHKLWRGYISGASAERSTRIDYRPMMPMLPLTVALPRALALCALRMPIALTTDVPTSREEMRGTLIDVCRSADSLCIAEYSLHILLLDICPLQFVRIAHIQHSHLPCSIMAIDLWLLSIA